MSKARVMVEVGSDGQPIRVFKNPKQAFVLSPERVKEMPRAEAVASIRHQIFVRSGGRCEYGCGKIVREFTWPQGEMHEQVPRGKGGEISLENSFFICPKCHRTDTRAHENRRLRFGESTNGV